MGARPFAEVLAEVTAALMDRPGVHAVGEGEHDGERCIVVLADESALDAIPRRVDGYVVRITGSDEIRATPGALDAPGG